MRAIAILCLLSLSTGCVSMMTADTKLRPRTKAIVSLTAAALIGTVAVLGATDPDTGSSCDPSDRGDMSSGSSGSSGSYGSSGSAKGHFECALSGPITFGLIFGTPAAIDLVYGLAYLLTNEDQPFAKK